MCDINAGKIGDLSIVNTNVAYDLVERRNIGQMGEGKSGVGGRVGSREDGGENTHEYESVGTVDPDFSSQQTGELSFRTGGGI